MSWGKKEGKGKTKDILDVQGQHQVTLWWFLASTLTSLHGTEQGSPYLKGSWSHPGSGDTGGSVEHEGQALPSQSLTKSALSQTTPYAEGTQWNPLRGQNSKPNPIIISNKYLLLIHELHHPKPNYFKTGISRRKDCYPFQTIILFPLEFLTHSLDLAIMFIILCFVFRLLSTIQTPVLS